MKMVSHGTALHCTQAHHHEISDLRLFPMIMPGYVTFFCRHNVGILYLCALYSINEFNVSSSLNKKAYGSLKKAYWTTADKV